MTRNHRDGRKEEGLKWVVKGRGKETSHKDDDLKKRGPRGTPIEGKWCESVPDYNRGVVEDVSERQGNGTK